MAPSLQPGTATPPAPDVRGMSHLMRGDVARDTHRPFRGVAANQLLLTPEEAARALRVGRTTVYALMKVGELRAVYIGRRCRLPAAELERYVSRPQRRRPDRGDG